MLVNLLIWSSGDRAVKAPRMDQEGWTQRWAVGGSPPPLAGQRRPRPDPTRPVAPCLWSPGVPRKLRPRRPGVRECRAAGGPAGVARWRSSRGWKPGSRAPSILLPRGLVCGVPVGSGRDTWKARGRRPASSVQPRRAGRGVRGRGLRAAYVRLCGRPHGHLPRGRRRRGHGLRLPAVPVLSRVPDLAGRAPCPSCHPALPGLWKHLCEAPSPGTPGAPSASPDRRLTDKRRLSGPERGWLLGIGGDARSVPVEKGTPTRRGRCPRAGGGRRAEGRRPMAVSVRGAWCVALAPELLVPPGRSGHICPSFTPWRNHSWDRFEY